MPPRLSDPARLLLSAYRQGAFPMATGRHGQVEFYTADPRAIVPLDSGFRVSRSLRARVRSGRFVVTSDVAFGEVVGACAETPRLNPDGSAAGTWINDWIIRQFTALHELGYAHSVEAWLPEREAGATPGDEHDDDARTRLVLVGGLYGVLLGSAFFGESMFSRPALGGTDASKVCLVHLVAHLRSRGVHLLDTQFANDHMRQFGVQEIPLKDYLGRLRKALILKNSWGRFHASPDDARAPGNIAGDAGD